MSDIVRNITMEKCDEKIPKTKENITRERALIRYLINNNILKQTRNNRLGLIWLVINPLITSLIYVFVFTVMRANLNAMNIIIGITIYRVITNSIKSGLASINDYRGGIYGERISTIILTKGMIGGTIINIQFQTIGAAIVLYFMFDVNLMLSMSLIFITTVWGVLAEGVMLNFAKLIKNLPDLNNIVIHVIQLLFFASPVLYGFNQTSGIHRSFNTYNPIMYVIEFQRGLISDVFTFENVNSYIPIMMFFVIVILSIRGYKSLDRVRWEVSSWS